MSADTPTPEQRVALSSPTSAPAEVFRCVDGGLLVGKGTEHVYFAA